MFMLYTYNNEVYTEINIHTYTIHYIVSAYIHTSNGLWMPSYILPMMPGPNSTDSGLPVRNTGSPMVTPAVG